MATYSITEACIGCGLCSRNCPVNAISGTRKERHAINADVCVRCGQCGRLCPKGAVLDPAGNPTVRIPKEQWMRPVIARECAGCSLCIMNCPMRCLEMSKPTFRGDTFLRAELVRADDCIGCGLCVNACPIEAIRLESSSHKQ